MTGGIRPGGCGIRGVVKEGNPVTPSSSVYLNITPERIVSIDYVNHRGERNWRDVLPLHIYFGSTERHPHEEQWLLAAIDVVKGERRVFAVSDIQDWVAATPRKGG